MRKTANPGEISRSSHAPCRSAPSAPDNRLCGAYGYDEQHASTSSSVTRFARSHGHKHIGRTRVPVVHFQKKKNRTRTRRRSVTHASRVAVIDPGSSSSSLSTRRTLKRLPCKRRAMSCRSASSESESDSNSSRSGDARSKAKPFELWAFGFLECTFDGSGPVVYDGWRKLVCETGRFLYG